MRLTLWLMTSSVGAPPQLASSTTDLLISYPVPTWRTASVSLRSEHAPECINCINVCKIVITDNLFIQVEIESKKLLMESLRVKVTELQEVTKNQQVDTELQVKALQGSRDIRGALK